jgi:hypothetical protein
MIHAHTYVSYLDTCNLKYLLIPANTLGFFSKRAIFGAPEQSKYLSNFSTH